MKAFMENHWECVELILWIPEGRDGVNLMTNEGASPLQLAAQQG